MSEDRRRPDVTTVDTPAALLRAVLAHQAVATAVVRDRTAYVVPDEFTAPLLHHAVTTDLPDGLAWHEPSTDLLVAGTDRARTNAAYREVWADNAYLRHGVALPDDAVVVDVGAGTGLFTLLAAAHSPGAHITAVEPAPAAVRAIEVNAELHSVDVTVVAAAVGRAGGPAVPTIPELVAGRRVDLLKVDGAGWEVFGGVDETTWSLIDQVAVAVDDARGQPAAALELLRGRGFTATSERGPVTGSRHVVYACRRPRAQAPRVPPPLWPTAGCLAEAFGLRRVELVRDLADLPPVGLCVVTDASVVLAEVWADLFGTTAVRPDADFFALGGDSMTAARLATRVRARLGVDALETRTVLTTPRFSDLAAAVEARAKS
ncbi:FkbM family methyltransferase [Actinokineospora auranticolor]|uniref:FkbM family methyltransferase n=1 Tax=Actinokineospora auranticolor TaxID=155976 RepID=A0A2S6GJQ6_9PSEU|nr:FkbM family methyltransferase [Actinokineospora auranticolor]PPK65386.1 FkbM family methyltransferase [Actinokineospora auranticolor]